jgi:hypothetical protein
LISQHWGSRNGIRNRIEKGRPQGRLFLEAKLKQMQQGQYPTLKKEFYHRVTQSFD